MRLFSILCCSLALVQLTDATVFIPFDRRFPPRNPVTGSDYTASSTCLPPQCAVIRRNIVNYSSGSITVGWISPDEAIAPMLDQAVAFALHKINQDPSILPNITLKAVAERGSGFNTDPLDNENTLEVLNLMGYASGVSANDSAGVPIVIDGTSDYRIGQLACRLDRNVIGAINPLPVFEDSSKFGCYTQMAASATVTAQAMRKAVEHLGWTTVVILRSQDDVSEAWGTRMTEALAERNITVAHQLSYTTTLPSIRTALLQILESTTTVILLDGQSPEATAMLWQVAISLGLLSPLFTWLATLIPVFTLESVRLASPGLALGVVAVLPGHFYTDYPSGQAWIADFMAFGNLSIGAGRFGASGSALPSIASAIYFSVEVAARGLHDFVEAHKNCTTHPSNGVCVDMAMRGEDAVLRSFIRSQKVPTLPASNSGEFNGGAAQSPMLVVQTVSQGIVARGIMTRSNGEPNFTPFSSFIWASGTSQTPPDTVLQQKEGIGIDSTLENAFMAMSAVWMITTVGVIVFYVVHFNTPLIRISAPRIGMLILIGILAATCTTFFPPSAHVEDWMARIALYDFGFSLICGSLFFKLYRVFNITARRKLMVNRITDLHILCMILCLLTYDATILLVWFAFDNMAISETPVGPAVRTASRPDVSVQTFYYSLDSDNFQTYVILVFASKGILLVFGVWLCVQTSNIPYSALNDSRVVASCIYTTVLLLLCVTPSWVVLDASEVSALFAVDQIAIFIQTGTVLAAVFFPRMVQVWTRGGAINLGSGTSLDIASDKSRPEPPVHHVRQRSSVVVTAPSLFKPGHVRSRSSGGRTRARARTAALPPTFARVTPHPPTDPVPIRIERFGSNSELIEQTVMDASMENIPSMESPVLSTSGSPSPQTKRRLGERPILPPIPHVVPPLNRDSDSFEKRAASDDSLEPPSMAE